MLLLLVLPVQAAWAQLLLGNPLQLPLGYPLQLLRRHLPWLSTSLRLLRLTCLLWLLWPLRLLRFVGAQRPKREGEGRQVPEIGPRLDQQGCVGEGPLKGVVMVMPP